MCVKSTLEGTKDWNKKYCYKKRTLTTRLALFCPCCLSATWRNATVLLQPNPDSQIKRLWVSASQRWTPFLTTWYTQKFWKPRIQSNQAATESVWGFLKWERMDTFYTYIQNDLSQWDSIKQKRKENVINICQSNCHHVVEQSKMICVDVCSGAMTL